MSLRTILATIGSSFFPALCIYCGKENKWLCVECTKKAEPFPHAVCPACDARAIDGKLEDSCTEKTGLTRFFCAYPLKNPVVRALVHTYKYRYGSTLHETISALLAQWLKFQNAGGLFDDSFVIVAVPLHKARLNARGFNQSELLARDFAQYFAVPLLTNVLARTKNTPSQLEVHNKIARSQNMQNAFEVTKNDALKGSRVILIDDVYTSGATMRECAAALRKAGAREVWGVAFARG